MQAFLRALRTMSRLGLAEYQVKLSDSMRVAMKIPIPASKAPQQPNGDPQPGVLEVVLTRGQMERLTAPLYRRMREAIDTACWQVGVCVKALSLCCVSTLVFSMTYCTPLLTRL